MNTYRMEKLVDGKVTESYEETTDMEFKTWKYRKALDKIQFRGAEMRCYINGERQYVSTNRRK